MGRMPQDLEGYGPHPYVHAFSTQMARSPQVVLNALVNDTKGRVHDVSVRVEAQGKESPALFRVAVEEVAIVEVPVLARVHDRLWPLVDRIVICLGEHREPSINTVKDSR